MLEIYLITGGIAMLVLKSTKQPPLATITKSLSRREEWVYFYQNYNTSCFVKKNNRDH